MAEAKTLNEVLKSLNKKFNDNVAVVGAPDITKRGTLSLGTPGLDYCLYNSLPRDRIIEIFGKEGSGKTTCAFLLAASFQREEMKKPEESRKKILYVDLEHTVDSEWAIKTGYDMSADAAVQTIYFGPVDVPAETVLDYVREFIKTGEIGLCIIDSIPMLVGEQVYDESFEKKEMGGIAKLLTSFVARITSILVKYDCTLIGINQMRDNIGGYGLPYTVPGGNQWKFGCSVRLMIKRGEFLDEDGNALTSSAESPAGYRMDMAVVKTKVCRWDRKIGSCVFSYANGPDILQDTIDVAIKLGLIDNSVQGSFKLIDIDTGEILKDSDGNEIKIRGKKNIKPYFKEHIDQYKKLYDKVYELISRKDTSNMEAFKQMLDYRDSKEVFGIDLNSAQGLEDI